MLPSAGDVDFSDGQHVLLRDSDKLTIIMRMDRGDSWAMIAAEGGGVGWESTSLAK
jgi:hypothetical protein